LLQLDELSVEAHEALAARKGFPPPWKDMAELEHAADAWIAGWLETRRELSRGKGVFARAHDRFDQWLRTDKVEHLDDPDYPVKKKVRIVRGVHRSNVLYRFYPRYVKLLSPLIREVAGRESRPARLLELASGSGELAMQICRLAQAQHLPVKITGSDYIPEYVEQAGARATERGLQMDFRIINAFEMSDLEPGEFDLILISQSTHHFTPGQLAMMIAQARRVATTAFVSIDGQRSLNGLLGIMMLPMLTFQFAMLHDGWISARKYFSRYELTHIPLIAAPEAAVNLRNAYPMVYLTVRFDGDAGV
jgi:2-polyprenyl-3-methyl-5-hydroxy-6-metoxy-1,4-benzoquinol methylase